MVSQPVTMLGGYDATLLAAEIANMAAGNAYNLSNMAGFYDPYMMGWASAPGGQVPTLNRDQLTAQVNQWGTQNALAQQGLQLDAGQLQLGNRSLDAQIANNAGQLQLGNRTLDAQIAQWAQQNQLDAGTLTGFYNGLPTLAREQLAATVGIANADNFRQWAQLRGSQLLQQQAQDDAMRVAAAESQLQTLGLLAQQRGPENFLAYNYLLNSLSAPDMQARDPFGIAQGLLQGVAPRSTVDLQGAWNAGIPGGGIPAPNMTAPPGSPRAPAPTAGTGGTGTGTAPPLVTQPRPAPAYVPPPSSTGLAISGNPQADAALAASSAWAGAPPEIMAEFNRISQGMTDTAARAAAQRAAKGLPPPQFAEGTELPEYANGTWGNWGRFMPEGFGFTNVGAGIVGDHPNGRQNREVFVNPTNAPIGIVPERRFNNRADPNAYGPSSSQGSGSGSDWSNWGSMIRDRFGNNDSLQQYFPGAASWGDIFRNGYRRPGPDDNGPPSTQPTSPTTPPPTSQPITPPASGAAPLLPNGRMVNLDRGRAFVNPQDNYWGQIPEGTRLSGRLPRFAAGTFGDTPFGNFGTFTPDQLAESPVVKQLQGQGGDVPLWTSYAGDMRLPGTQSALPLTFNVADFSRMSPSARKMAQGLYETPRALGGLGMDWEDVLQASTRAAPLGARHAWAGYGW